MSDYQKSTTPCECGGVMTVERGENARTFLAHCARCKRHLQISWFTGSPAPLFEGDRAPRLPLRSECES